MGNSQGRRWENSKNEEDLGYGVGLRIGHLDGLAGTWEDLGMMIGLEEMVQVY